MMRRRFRWVGAVVVVSALAGAAVAITDAPAATSTTPEHHVAGAIAGDPLAPEIDALTQQAHDLGVAIKSAQQRLVVLQGLVSVEVSRQHQSASAVATTVPDVARSHRPAKKVLVVRPRHRIRTTPDDGSPSPTTTEVTTTTEAPATVATTTTSTTSTTSTTVVPVTTTTVCPSHRGNDATGSSVTTTTVAPGCYGGGHDD